MRKRYWLAGLLTLCMALSLWAGPASSDSLGFRRITGGSLSELLQFWSAAAWADLNGDGRIDVYIPTDQYLVTDPYRNYIFYNNGDNTFTRSAPFTDSTGKKSKDATLLDLDQDGILDVFSANYAEKNTLFYGMPDNGAYVRGYKGGLVESESDIGASNTVSFTDIDGDGDLDCYLGRSDDDADNMYLMNHRQELNVFWQSTVGSETRTTNCVTWVDLDGDGDQELVVGHPRGIRLYNNNGGGNLGQVDYSWINTNVRTLSWADYDNDGDLDGFVGNWEEASILLNNDGLGRLSAVSGVEIAQKTGPSFGSAWGDFNNDGYEDLITVSAGGYENFIYRNRGDGTFKAVDAGIKYFYRHSSSCTTADIDGDGDLDVLVTNANSEMDLFENVTQSNGNTWVEFKLKQRGRNQAAIGARVRCKAVIDGEPMWLLRQVFDQTGRGGHSSRIVHFGLDETTVIDSVIIDWPWYGRDVLTNLDVNQLYEVTQGQTQIAIDSVTDVPDDQGGFVDVAWNAHIQDKAGESLPITHYALWQRRQADPTVLGKVMSSSDVDSVAWQKVAEVSAAQLNGYTAQVATPVDSVAGAPYQFAYVVVAHTGVPTIYYESESVMGYSVDNLAPEAPSALVLASELENSRWVMKLNWSASSASDLAHYVVERATDSFAGSPQDVEQMTSISVSFTDTTVAENTVYFYRVAARDVHGNLSAWTEESSLKSQVDEGVGMPRKFALAQNHPNPFNPSTSINVAVPKAASVKVFVYNMAGQRVRSLTDGTLAAGRHTLMWDARDDSGQAVPTGVYFVVMEAGDFRATRKMLYLK